MAQRPSGNFTARRHIADQLDAIRIRRLGGIQFLVSAFHAIYNGRKRQVTIQAGPAVGMKRADSRADLVIGIARYVFHQKVDQAGIPLEDVQDLQSPIADLYNRSGGRYRCGLRLRKAELRRYIFGKHARKKNRKEAAECSRESRQIGSSK